MYKFFIDLDNTLFKLNDRNGAKPYLKKGYFLTQKPFKNIDRLNDLIGQYPDRFYIISAITFSYQADEKKAQLRQYLPALKDENILLISNINGVCDKSKYVSDVLGRPLTQHDVLIDDYHGNLCKWDGGILQRRHTYTTVKIKPCVHSTKQIVEYAQKRIEAMIA